MDIQSGRHIFGFDTDPAQTARTMAESAGGRWNGVARRARNPAQHFHDLPNPTGSFPFHLKLEDILGTDAIQEIVVAGRMVFHAIGDTGQKSHGAAAQEAVAEHIAAQARPSLGLDRARFAYHLGDVVYFKGERDGYEPQFYEPYKNYAAPIFAIAGNHDGDVPDGDTPLQGFMEHFCSTQASHSPWAGESPRTAMTQPHCYWTLLTPFARIIGLYSNVTGQLDRNNTRQFDWLVDQLQHADTDRFVIVAVHHPAYSRDTAHGGYRAIDDALDAAFRKADRWPHLVLAGHVHNYQRFERNLATEFQQNRTLTYCIAGGSGYAGFDGLHKVAPADALPSDVSAETFVDDLPGFLTLEMTPTTIRGRYHAVPRPPQHLDGPTVLRDDFTVTLT
jgi:acid phosphatase type 7